MPNHIQNKLRLIGGSAEVKKVLSFISGKDDEGAMQIDFNKIIPMPKELSIISDGWLMPLENSFSFHEPMKAHLDKMRERILSKTMEESTIDNFIQGIKNYLKHGHATWHDWAVENWDTKWNAYGQNDDRNTPDTIYFQTAWASPLKVIEKLSATFPKATFMLDYADEDSGSNTGHFEIKNGKIVSFAQPDSQSKEGYDIYFSLHPDSINDYRLTDGKYAYIGE